MDLSAHNKLDLLERIAEVKRIYTVIDSAIKGPSCIAVSSSAHGEGKSILVAGLALAASKAGAGKVLVVDFNWYTPALDIIFQVEKTDKELYFTNGWSFEKLVRPTKKKDIDIITAPGSVNDQLPVGMGSRGLFSEILKQAKEQYSTVIVDTSAVFPTNQKMVDPVEICRFSDGVVIVTLTDVTTKQELKRTCKTIEATGANILGIVANNWRNPLL